MGVIMYILLCGYPPFNADNDNEILEKIAIGDFDFPEEEWGDVSREAKQLIKKMLQKDPRNRPTAMEILKDLWF